MSWVVHCFTFLNCDQNEDFVIDLDDVWKWLGFNQKEASKCVLERYFVIGNDYKTFAPPVGGAKKGHGGHNKGKLTPISILLMHQNEQDFYCL